MLSLTSPRSCHGLLGRSVEFSRSFQTVLHDSEAPLVEELLASSGLLVAWSLTVPSGLIAFMSPRTLAPDSL